CRRSGPCAQDAAEAGTRASPPHSPPGRAGRGAADAPARGSARSPGSAPPPRTPDRRHRYPTAGTSRPRSTGPTPSTSSLTAASVLPGRLLSNLYPPLYEFFCGLWLVILQVQRVTLREIYGFSAKGHEAPARAGLWRGFRSGNGRGCGGEERFIG